MKIAELITLLSRYPGEAEVFLSYPAHDHCHSQIASPVRHARNENITPSTSLGHVVVSEERRERMDEDERADVRDVVVLR